MRFCWEKRRNKIAFDSEINNQGQNGSCSKPEMNFFSEHYGLGQKGGHDKGEMQRVLHFEENEADDDNCPIRSLLMIRDIMCQRLPDGLHSDVALARGAGYFPVVL